MTINSRQKGKRGELEAAALLTELLHEKFIRGVQYHGGDDSPDIMPEDRSSLLSVIHWEVKWVQALSLYEALAQAVRDAGDSKIPVVIHKKNNKEPVIIVRLSDFSRLAQVTIGRLTNAV